MGRYKDDSESPKEHDDKRREVSEGKINCLLPEFVDIIFHWARILSVFFFFFFLASFSC